MDKKDDYEQLFFKQYILLRLDMPGIYAIAAVSSQHNQDNDNNFLAQNELRNCK